MKVIAFYLPQFHTIPENDEWWGKGFTDWVNVRKAHPLFHGHCQPREPLGRNYYDLSDPDTLRWQSQLASKYHVHGFCFYHYWFGGKLLLQKPAELLLANKDIRLPFCFSWANEPWARTWDGKAHHILINQVYGNREDWEKHFRYLLPFFQDDRYIIEDGRPMFLIYKSQSIPCINEMMECWEQMAIQSGFKGMHFVETLRTQHRDPRPLPFRARVEFEPARAQWHQSPLRLNWDRVRRRVVRIINNLCHTNIPHNKPIPFNEIADFSLNALSPKGTYGGVFMGWDNTPRKGLSGNIITSPTKQEFEAFLQSKIKITKEKYGTDYIFVNAWNEWAEGTFLEPTEDMKYQYLEAIEEVTT